MQWHLASLWEDVADAVPDAAAIVQGQRRLSWRDYDDRSARLASAMAAAGVGPDSKVALYLYNSVEYLEAQYAACKIRAVPVNVSYRYRDDELAYLLENSDAEVVVYDAAVAPYVARVIARGLPTLKLLIEVGPDEPAVPGARSYRTLVAESAPLPRMDRSADDVYMLYTGGTTGLPKGVMYSNHDHTRKLLQMMATLYAQPAISSPSDAAHMAQAIAPVERRPVWLPACPLMHATGMMLGAMGPHLVGCTVVLLESRTFDPDELWTAVALNGVSSVIIVGDAFGRPMLDALRRARESGHPYDTSSVRMLFSGGAALSPEVKQGLLDLLPEAAVIIDVLGSTEGGMGSSSTTRESAAEGSHFALDPCVHVLDEAGEPVRPGSGERGRVALSRYVPLGYYKDPERSALAFPTLNGVRYSFPGDWATVEADGSITLLGRGSQVINSGGEKVFCEEVEETVKAHPDIVDCLVLGLPDERLGNRVVAVASTAAPVSERDVIDWVKQQLAGYKAPKQVVFVPQVPRQPNGKADYPSARELAEAGLLSRSDQGAERASQHDHR